MIHSQACKTCDTPNSATCATSGQDGEGVPDADFVVYVAARSSRCTGNFLAYAAHCFHDKSTDRFGLLICYHSLCMDACVHVCILRCAFNIGIHTTFTHACMQYTNPRYAKYNESTSYLVCSGLLLEL